LSNMMQQGWVGVNVANGSNRKGHYEPRSQTREAILVGGMGSGEFHTVSYLAWVYNDVDAHRSENFHFTGTAPYNLYNGALRMYYEYSAAALKNPYTNFDGSLDYEGGSQARLDLKTEVRNLTLSAQRKVLNATDPIKPTTKATPRFWVTNKGYNIAGKLGAASGIIGVGVAGYRIATAENKLKETGKVASGFAGAWAGMQVVAPLAAWGAAASGPAAPFVAGGILFIGGTAGAIGAEALFDYLGR